MDNTIEEAFLSLFPLCIYRRGRFTDYASAMRKKYTKQCPHALTHEAFRFLLGTRWQCVTHQRLAACFLCKTMSKTSQKEQKLYQTPLKSHVGWPQSHWFTVRHETDMHKEVRLGYKSWQISSPKLCLFVLPQWFESGQGSNPPMNN